MSLTNQQKCNPEYNLTGERIFPGMSNIVSPHSAFQHLSSTLSTHSTFSPGEDGSQDQQDQEDIREHSILGTAQLSYLDLFTILPYRIRSMKFCQHFHSIHQSAPQQPNSLPTKRSTHPQKTGNSAKIQSGPRLLKQSTKCLHLYISSTSWCPTASWHKQVLGIIQTAVSVSSPDFQK